MKTLRSLAGHFQRHTSYPHEVLAEIIIGLLKYGYSRGQVAQWLAFSSPSDMHRKADKVLGFKLEWYAHPRVGGMSAVHVLEAYDKRGCSTFELAEELGMEEPTLRAGVRRARKWLEERA